MSKYATEVVKLNKEKDSIELQAIEAAEILSSDLQAQIFTQKGIISRKQSELKRAEDAVIKAQYYLTNDVDTYLTNLSNKWQTRDKIAADLDQAEATFDKLSEVVKIFV